MADRCRSQFPSLDALSKFRRVSTILKIRHPEATQLPITVTKVVQVLVIQNNELRVRLTFHDCIEFPLT